MKTPPTLEDAIALAVTAHKGQKDKADAPYILHPLRVMFRCGDETERIVAVLHDVVEDTSTTLEDLRALGYSEAVVAAVDAVTQRKGEGKDDYLRRVAQNPIARQVKLADLEDNMDLRRLPEVTERDRSRLNRYLTVWRELKGLRDFKQVLVDKRDTPDTPMSAVVTHEREFCPMCGTPADVSGQLEVEGPHCGYCALPLTTVHCEECPNCGCTALTSQTQTFVILACTKCGGEHKRVACDCILPTPWRCEEEGVFVGVDKTQGRYGDVWRHRCGACGRAWLLYRVEYEAFTGSGRWYRALITPDVKFTAENAETLLASSPLRIRGGSFFRSAGQYDQSAQIQLS